MRVLSRRMNSKISFTDSLPTESGDCFLQREDSIQTLGYFSSSLWDFMQVCFFLRMPCYKILDVFLYMTRHTLCIQSSDLEGRGLVDEGSFSKRREHVFPLGMPMGMWWAIAIAIMVLWQHFSKWELCTPCCQCPHLLRRFYGVAFLIILRWIDESFLMLWQAAYGLPAILMYACRII